MRRVMGNSQIARAEFVERMKCVPRMLSAKNARLGSPLAECDLEDVAQDTIAAVWRRLPVFEGRSALETWVYRFCHLHLCKFLDARRRLPRPVPEVADVPGAEQREAVVERSAADFEEVYRALDRLDAEEARILRLKHFDHLTFQEIGARLSISPNTAKTRYYRGLERMRELLDESLLEEYA